MQKASPGFTGAPHFGHTEPAGAAGAAGAGAGACAPDAAMISAMDLPQPAQNMSEALMRVWQNGHTTTVAACCEAAFWRSISSSCAWRDARSGDAVEELLAPGAERGVVLRDLVEARAELRGELLAALHGVIHLVLDLEGLDAAVCPRDAAIQRSLNIIEKAHRSTFSNACGHNRPTARAVSQPEYTT